MLDPGESLSFVTPYVDLNFEFIREQLSEPLTVSTPISKSILAERVYCDCPIFVSYKSAMTDLIGLDVVDFDVILGMNYLHAYYSSIDFRTRVMKFQIPNELVIEWTSSSFVPKSRFIYYLKARKLVFKGCIDHLVRVNDSSAKISSL